MANNKLLFAELEMMQHTFTTNLTLMDNIVRANLTLMDSMVSEKVSEVFNATRIYNEPLIGNNIFYFVLFSY